MDATSQTAIVAGNHMGVADDTICDDLRMLDQVRCVAYDPGDKQLAIGQFRFFPDPPFMLVADVAGFNRVDACVNAEHQVDDVPQRNVGGVRAVPASPANVVADAILRQPAERMIDGINATGPTPSTPSGEHAGQRPTQPGSEKDAAEYAEADYANDVAISHGDTVVGRGAQQTW